MNPVAYLAGERTPHNDSQIRGAFLGLSKETDRDALVQAVFEGVAFAMRDCFDVLNAAGTRLDTAYAIGGGAQSEYWLQVIATVLDIDLHIPEEREFGAALGAARIAICGTTKATPESVMTPPTIAKTISPNATLRQPFHQAYQNYKPLYANLKDAL